MISGPYTSGASNAVQRAENLRAMNLAALAVFRKGHIPIIGVNLALPIIEAAGAEAYDEIMMPIALAAAERCGARLRIGGASKGADEEVERFRAAGRPIYFSIDDIPAANPR